MNMNRGVGVHKGNESKPTCKPWHSVNLSQRGGDQFACTSHYLYRHA